MEMWWLILKMAHLLAHQTYRAKIPNSNSTSPTMILMRCRIIVSLCRKSQGREENIFLIHCLEAMCIEVGSDLVQI